MGRTSPQIRSCPKAFSRASSRRPFHSTCRVSGYRWPKRTTEGTETAQETNAGLSERGGTGGQFPVVAPCLQQAPRSPLPRARESAKVQRLISAGSSRGCWWSWCRAVGLSPIATLAPPSAVSPASLLTPSPSPFPPVSRWRNNAYDGRREEAGARPYRGPPEP